MAFKIDVNFIADGLNNESKDAFASAYGYTATIPDPANPGQTIPNPVTKTQFRDQCIKNYVKEVIQAERTKADQAAVPKRPVGD